MGLNLSETIFFYLSAVIMLLAIVTGSYARHRSVRAIAKLAAYATGGTMGLLLADTVVLSEGPTVASAIAAQFRFLVGGLGIVSGLLLAGVLLWAHGARASHAPSHGTRTGSGGNGRASMRMLR